MDSESPHAVGIAGQVRSGAGVPFTSIVGTNSEFRAGFGRDRTGGAPRRPPGSRYRHRADGDGS